MTTTKKLYIVLGALVVLVIARQPDVGSAGSGAASRMSAPRWPAEVCNIRKANGMPGGDRPCDLAELCEDAKFRLRKIREAETADERLKQMVEAEKIDRWINEYRREDALNVCQGRYEPYVGGGNGVMNSVAGSNASPTRGECSKSPLEVFPSGDKISRAQVESIASGQCNGATIQADGTVDVSHAGQAYQVITKPSGDGQVEIVSIRGKRTD